MLRANVYSVNDLTPNERDSVYDGIDQFAGLISETVQLEEKSTYTTTEELIALSPYQIAAALDWQVDLHLIVKPIDLAERLGEAYLGRGLGFVDLSKSGADMNRAVTAHETAHSIGLVIGGSGHSDPNSEHHCASPSCLMHPTIKLNGPCLIDREHAGLVAQTMIGLEANLSSSSARPEGLNKPADFCYDCKNDLKTRGSGLLHGLRIARIMHRQVSID
jgi:hypothetical protein